MKYEKVNNFTPPKQKHHFKIGDKVIVIRERWPREPHGSIFTITSFGLSTNVVFANNSPYMIEDLKPIT